MFVLCFSIAELITQNGELDAHTGINLIYLEASIHAETNKFWIRWKRIGQKKKNSFFKLKL
jgi:hypothetical protein